jgi:hypothetical protein
MIASELAKPEAVGVVARAAGSDSLQAATHGLLRSYCTALRHARGSLARSFVTAYVRGAADDLHRAVGLRALDAPDDEGCENELEHFAASLPPPRPRAHLVLGLLTIFVVAQALKEIGKACLRNTEALVNQVSQVDALDFSKIANLIRALAHSDVRTIIFVFWVYAVATWLVGFWPARECRRAVGLLERARSQERAMFGRLSAPAPAAPTFDLWITGAGVLALALMSTDLLVLGLQADDSALVLAQFLVGGVIGLLAAVGCVLLLRRARARRER